MRRCDADACGNRLRCRGARSGSRASTRTAAPYAAIGAGFAGDAPTARERAAHRCDATRYHGSGSDSPANTLSTYLQLQLLHCRLGHGVGGDGAGAELHCRRFGGFGSLCRTHNQHPAVSVYPAGTISGTSNGSHPTAGNASDRVGNHRHAAARDGIDWIDWIVRLGLKSEPSLTGQTFCNLCACN
jgi:hypothetical protein